MRVPPSIAEEALSETVPTAIPANSLGIEDFELLWSGKPIPGVKFSLEPSSVQWVRIQDILVVPRARLQVDVEGLGAGDAGQIANTGFVEPLFIQNQSQSGHAEVTVPLMSGASNPISITLKKGKMIQRGTLILRFKPRSDQVPQESRIAIDPSCSPYKVKIESLALASDDWVYVGCRLARVQSSKARTSSLEVFVYWDNVGQSIQVDGIDTVPTSTSLWTFRLASEPGTLNLKSKAREINLTYSTPKVVHDGKLSLGVGPYDYQFQGNGENLKSIQALLSLYSSYFITETIQVAAFGSTTLNGHHFTDLGLYLRFENYRVFDRRLGVNFLLGGHAVGFKSMDQYYFVYSVPQGIEIVYYDALAKNINLTVGAFIQPFIDGRAYYNIWLRWGGQVFAELDYYLWQANPNGIPFTNSSIGLSLGFPVFEFM